MGSLGDHAVGRVGAMVAMVVLLGTLQGVPPASATSNGVLGWGASLSMTHSHRPAVGSRCQIGP